MERGKHRFKHLNQVAGLVVAVVRCTLHIVAPQMITGCTAEDFLCLMPAVMDNCDSIYYVVGGSAALL